MEKEGSKDQFKPNHFIRVGTSYYKMVQQPMMNGEVNRKLVIWNKNFLKADDIDLNKIRKYDDFVNFQTDEIFDNFFNLFNYKEVKVKIPGRKTLLTEYHLIPIM